MANNESGLIRVQARSCRRAGKSDCFPAWLRPDDVIGNGPRGDGVLKEQESLGVRKWRVLLNDAVKGDSTHSLADWPGGRGTLRRYVAREGDKPGDDREPSGASHSQAVIQLDRRFPITLRDR